MRPYVAGRDYAVGFGHQLGITRSSPASTWSSAATFRKVYLSAAVVVVTGVRGFLCGRSQSKQRVGCTRCIVGIISLRSKVNERLLASD